MIAQVLENFHWLRPLWLLGVPFVLIASYLLLRNLKRANNWQSLIDPSLLSHLIDGEQSPQQKWPFTILAFAGLITCLALAGPSWEKLPQPIHKTEHALVIVLDLSPSMMAEDLKPSRLIRARLKLIDLLNQRKEGITALVAYAGEAHVVTPLTDDSKTITNLLPSLSPRIMPLQGSNTEMAIDAALTLFKDSGALEGDILLVTDGVESQAIDSIKTSLSPSYRLSILGVGTTEGAPIPINNGGFAKDRSANMVLAKLNADALQNLASSGKGIYRNLSARDTDLTALIEFTEASEQKTRQLERDFDTWQDRGPWLALLLLPIIAFSFRRGWVLSVLILTLPLPQPAYAFGWKDLWQTPDQQGQELLAQDPMQAAQTFEDSQWRGTAHYRANDFDQAAAEFATRNDATAHFNRGNALAKSGKLKESIEAYDSAIEQQTDFSDAQFNRKLVEDLLKQQQEQNQDKQQDSDQEQDKSDQPSEDQDSSNSEDQDSSNSEDQESSDDSQQQEGESEEQKNDQESDDDQDSPADQDKPSKEDEESSEDKEPSKEEESSNKDSQEENQPPSKPEESEAEKTEAQQAALEESELNPEEQQAMEQWLRTIPDDPSGLMRKKFEYQHRQRRKEYQNGTWQPPENEAHQRW